MVRFGIAGFGHHAVKRLIPGFDKAKRCAVTALSRRNRQDAQASARQFDIPHAFTSAAELCACPEVDAVFVASPDALHQTDVLEAVGHGKPVLVEKPMAMNSGEAREMVEAARSAGVLLGVAHNMRFEQSVQWFRERVSQFGTSKPLLARATFVAPMLSSPRSWVHDPRLATGGPLADLGVHLIDTLRYILDDEVESVMAEAQYDSHSVLEASAFAVLRFSRGTLASIAVSGRGNYQTLVEVIGETTVLSGINALSVDGPATLEARLGQEAIERREVMNDNACALQLDAFAAAIEECRDFEIPGEQGLRNQLVLDAAYRSLQSGRAEATEAPA